jgi:hypothetical protein
MAAAASSSDDESEVPTQQAGQHSAHELSNQELPALFWDALPDEKEKHADWAALEALREECTPRERAETFKVCVTGLLS